MSKQTFAIVGAGPAGAKAAETLREEGFDGRLVLIGDELPLPGAELDGVLYLRTVEDSDAIRASEQYAVGMEYSGYATDWDEIVFRSDPRTREFNAFWLKDDRPLAGMNVNVWDVTDDIQGLIRARRPADRARLADPITPLSDLSLQRAQAVTDGQPRT